MDLSGEIASIHMRTDAKNLDSKNDSPTLTKGNHPQDFYVAKGGKFRKYS